MNWRPSVKHVNKKFLPVCGATFISPDINLWGPACLRSKGVTDEQFLGYRRLINGKIANQMSDFWLVDPAAVGAMGVASTHDQRSVDDER
jgi:hypothetical protein